MKYLILLASVSIIIYASLFSANAQAYSEDLFPCKVYGEPNLLNQIRVVAWINQNWSGSKFITYPDPLKVYDDFHTLKVIGYIDRACYNKTYN